MQPMRADAWLGLGHRWRQTMVSANWRVATRYLQLRVYEVLVGVVTDAVNVRTQIGLRLVRRQSDRFDGEG